MENKVARASHIIKRSSWTDLAGSEKRLCLYFRPSRRTGNRIVIEEILQVDCHVPASEDYKARQIIRRVKELLYNKEMGGRIYEFEGQLGELPTAEGFYCAGARFVFYALK